MRFLPNKGRVILTAMSFEQVMGTISSVIIIPESKTANQELAYGKIDAIRSSDSEEWGYKAGDVVAYRRMAGIAIDKDSVQFSVQVAQIEYTIVNE